jgi:hypothetical protein
MGELAARAIWHLTTQEQLGFAKQLMQRGFLAGAVIKDADFYTEPSSLSGAGVSHEQ